MTMSISQIGFEIVSKLDNYDLTPCLITLLGKKSKQLTLLRYWLLTPTSSRVELAATNQRTLGEFNSYVTIR